MDATWRTNIDHTEDAAVLLRRLLELLATTTWVLQDESEVDIRALRVELAGVREQQRMAQQLIDLGAPNAQTRMENVNRNEEWVNQELASRGAPPQERPRITQMMDTIELKLRLAYAVESSVAHFGLIGRTLQRDGVALGADARPWRRAQVATNALVAYGGIVDRSFSHLGFSSPMTDEFVSEIAEPSRQPTREPNEENGYLDRKIRRFLSRSIVWI